MIQYFPIVTGSLTVLGNINVSGSITTSGSITISGSITSASFASTASFVALAQSASNAVSAVTASFANNLTVAGTLTAQTLVVQTITSSVSTITGSTNFGSLSSNTHTFTGSMNVSGSAVTFLGSLGVGSPANEKFGVVGTTGSQGFVRWSDGVTTSAFLGITGSTAFIHANNNILGLGANSGNNYSPTMVVNNGSVGIGTTSPAQSLEVNGNILASSTGKIGFRYSSTNGNYYSYLRSATASGVGPIVLAGGFESDGGGNEAIRLSTNNSAGGERTVLSINNAGTSTFYGDTSLQGNNYINSAKMIQWEGGSYWAWRTVSSATVFQLYRGDSGATPIQIDNDNKVTITGAVTYPLTVTNSTNTSGRGVFVTVLGSNNNNASSYHYIASTGGADKYYLYGNGTYTTVSDVRLKKNISTVTDTYLNKVKDLRIVNYHWNDQEDSSPLEFGMIAQEVEEIIPSIVHEGREHEDNIKYKGIQASVLPYILIKAIQELNTKFEEYKATHP
jgi:hypothetical protein